VQKRSKDHKGTVMHIASGLTLVRRNPAQSEIANPPILRPGWLAWPRTPERAVAARAKLARILPGAVLLTALALLGALFPILF
jgi:hypothetical protein